MTFFLDTAIPDKVRKLQSPTHIIESGLAGAYIGKESPVAG